MDLHHATPGGGGGMYLASSSSSSSSSFPPKGPLGQGSSPSPTMMMQSPPPSSTSPRERGGGGGMQQQQQQQQQLSNGQLPQGSKLVTYMNRQQGFQPSVNPAASLQQQQQQHSSIMRPEHLNQQLNGGSNSSGLNSGLKKLNLSGVPEFVPNNLGRSSPAGMLHQQQQPPPTNAGGFGGNGGGGRFSLTPSPITVARGGSSSNNYRLSNAPPPPPPTLSSSSSLSTPHSLSAGGLSPRHSPTPTSVAANASGDMAAAAAGPDISTFSDGGTTYFYNSDEMPVSGNMANGGAVSSSLSILMPDYQSYSGTPSFVANMKVRSNVPGFLAENELKVDLLKRQQICMAQIDPEAHPHIPSEVDNFTNLCPLEPPPPSPMHKSHTFGYVTSVYKATNMKSGLHVCLRRIHGYRLVNTKCMVLVEQWRKLSHSNLVALRQVFTTKSFGDHSMVFVYDFFPGAETLMTKHFNSPSQVGGGSSAFMDPFGGTADGARPYSQHKNQLLRQQAMLTQNGLLTESLIWTYVIQLTSALRHIHSAGLACRTLDPTKILVVNKARLLLNCGGIFDVITFDPSAANPMAAMAHYQQEDLVSLGKIVLALACNSFLAIQRENLQTSMEIVTSTYSSDLRNLIMYLLTNPTRVKSVNDLMPMIGARFYTQLDAAYMRNDVIESELSKEIESSRLFRLLAKLSTIVDRAELNGDFGWAEYGDRYMLKLFRDYVFHQVMEDNRPWLDMAHVIACLNKLDAGVPDKVCLMSRDEQNVLVVSYSELKHCLEQSFGECVSAHRTSMGNGGMVSSSSAASGVGGMASSSAASSHNY